jgi:hypothetical protein
MASRIEWCAAAGHRGHLRDAKRLEQLKHAAKLDIGKTRAGTSRVQQSSVIIVITEEQRPEIGA